MACHHDRLLLAGGHGLGLGQGGPGLLGGPSGTLQGRRAASRACSRRATALSDAGGAAGGGA
ncbi:MAG TPA: hypothetical protein VGW74_18280, partial [Propionibacteriaceae bacterium]|nr:hypothetical protein [Propionibacteriaceae bacterium]